MELNKWDHRVNIEAGWIDVIGAFVLRRSARGPIIGWVGQRDRCWIDSKKKPPGIANRRDAHARHEGSRRAVRPGGCWGVVTEENEDLGSQAVSPRSPGQRLLRCCVPRAIDQPAVSVCRAGRRPRPWSAGGCRGWRGSSTRAPPSPSAPARPAGGWLRNGICHGGPPTHQRQQSSWTPSERGLFRHTAYQQGVLCLFCVQFFVAPSSISVYMKNRPRGSATFPLGPDPQHEAQSCHS
jgi:hypothetical protein